VPGLRAPGVELRVIVRWVRPSVGLGEREPGLVALVGQHLHHPQHRHAATLDDTFDFLNTSELDGSGRAVEHFTTLVDVTGWLEEHRLLHPARRAPLDALPAQRAAVLLDHVVAVRAGLREVVEALVGGRPVDDQALATVNAVLRARSPVELVRGEGGIALSHRHAGDPLDDALAAVAEPLVGLIATGDTDRLRICANDGCRWVFQDTSRTGRRRWCSMASCGNRAKAARHRARKRAAAGEPGALAESPGGAPAVADFVD
jgi:predicted RNA-binding Zn ribbon-like protein